MSPVVGPNRSGWRLLVLATALVASVSLVMSPILYLRTTDAFHQLRENRLELCRDANERHDRTIDTLDREIRRLPAGQRAEANRNRKSTVALLEAIAPRRDCGQSLR